MSKNEISICDECGSRFLKSASHMAHVCPECSLYYMDTQIVTMFSEMVNAFIAIGMANTVNI